MVVEDEWFLRMELADALADIGWAVVELATGEQALDWLEAGGEAALLVTDIRLTGLLEGWDVAERFHAENPETKRRFRNLVEVSGLIDHLTPIKPLTSTR